MTWKTGPWYNQTREQKRRKCFSLSTIIRLKNSNNKKCSLCTICTTFVHYYTTEWHQIKRVEGAASYKHTCRNRYNEWRTHNWLRLWNVINYEIIDFWKEFFPFVVLYRPCWHHSTHSWHFIWVFLYLESHSINSEIMEHNGGNSTENINFLSLYIYFFHISWLIFKAVFIICFIAVS